MILVKKINQQEIMVNPDLIETIEFSPHAVMSLTTGVKVIVDETPDDLLHKIVEFRRAINHRPVDFRVVSKTGSAKTGSEG
jgi:flagellar protein FlbD